MIRCAWVTDDPLYIKYHDMEWGVPLHEDTKLFEMLILEGAQAGLSWLTILKRRETYRIAYDGFDPAKIAKWNSTKIDQLLKDPGIIRNRLKVESAIINARAYLKVRDEFNSFDEFIWSFVEGRPIQNSWQEIGQIPATTAESERMSKELKRRGFKFVGSTICYAFMQAVGMVNDHVTDCFRYALVKDKP
ncbi:MAG: DNA-3-methyladenine glycosylase I [Proteobacteria bacterium]|nr:DNA-3-methyladenine glycosylase I [Desulfocapsa sp.]MBU3945838.1 DNA-3-methyladenine glycosylase I [Pseudomonadota bacterium]MCG2743359.1 DNA-3-methyladenine glycosylase I [Desulfobacteraceae bacterium]MBU3983300.1 DNA-3-methyladenine glycosylase I [Pseudomonadota bacterium]MBU4030130.1 DNA-3-methyladenine glycosylase I [Pseudomonadota bacterium]